MTGVIFAVVVAALICGLMWRRPDARAAATGAWQAGKAQAAQEFREGYTFAQQRLRSGNPSWKSPRRWTSWLLASAWGAGQTVVAANRIRARAWDGGRTRYREWQAARPIDAEVIDDEVDANPGDRAESGDPPLTGRAECPRCGATHTVTIPSEEHDVWVTCPCGHRINFFREPNDPPDNWDDPPDTPDSDREPEPHHQPHEEPDMQTEATGLTSYAAAHAQFAGELRAQMSGSENLAASMSGILADHSDLIGQTAVLQDLLNQAAGIADQIAARATTVANN